MATNRSGVVLSPRDGHKCGTSLNVIRRSGCAHAGAGEDRWMEDPVSYLRAFYDQFCNIIVMATFTGGVQAAVLALMNDVLSDGRIEAELFKEPTPERYTRYTSYSLGLMIGLLAVALNVGVGAIATVNAALAFHFTVSLPTQKPSMEVRVVFCMLVMFVAFLLSGVSIILLSIKFDIPFTLILAILFFAAIVIAAFQFVARYGMKWIDALLGKPLHFFSVLASTAAFIVDITRPVPQSWYTISAYGFTILYHIVAVLYGTSPTANVKRPRRTAAFCATILSLAWAGCIAVTIAWRVQYSRADRPLRYVLAGLAAVETLFLGAIASKNWYDIIKACRHRRRHGDEVEASTAEKGQETQCEHCAAHVKFPYPQGDPQV
ncbi:hypothetical protein FA13DRAFT_1791444 [Coprinellus micaceus]|uniref:Uncharacterized protein n=1 Tax=Coprinellus micaceus TaxID=71717 RepID=A0A4Y7TBY8_COPMI|nr:hypothetical protein FA13DRAFT_1791444 [Coprinellus micaceus]